MFRKVVALVVVALIGGTVFAGPFFRRPSCRGPSCHVAAPEGRISITPLPEYKQEVPPVQQPWLLTSVTDDSFSQQPDTVLEPVPGTGSRLGIGPKVPDKITHVLDPETLKKISDLLTATSSAKQPVAITLPVTDATSQQWSRILTALEWLLYVGGVFFAGSKVGPVLQLVARVASGLPSAIAAQSSAPTPTAAATSSTPASQ